MGDKRSIAATKRGQKGHDISIKFYDSFIRTMDALKKSFDALSDQERDMDERVNNGVGYVEDRKLTHGISMGATSSPVYGGVDLVYNPNSGEYLVLKKNFEIVKYDWTGKKVGSHFPTKKFTRFLYIPQTGNYICYNPKKSSIYILKEEFNLAIDTVCITPIDRIVYGGRKADENSFEFFVVFEDNLNECLKIADVEAEGATISQICFDEPMDDKKQWIYMTFKNHCTIIDSLGRSHGTRKNLHKLTITAIVAAGPSEYVITGDSSGLLKMWGSRWSFIMEVKPHTAVCNHLIEHPNGRAVVSISEDQSMYSWSLDSKKKLEALRAPEIVERIAQNRAGKSFMTMGPRKLVLWKMEELFKPLAQMSAPVALIKTTWNPDYLLKAVVASQDNAIRMLNPVTGKMVTSALVNPMKPPLTDYAYLPQYAMLYVIKTPSEEPNSLEIQMYDCKVNPAKLKETWSETKWNIAITAIALYEHIPSLILPEKSLKFTRSKQAPVINGPTTFLIVGMRDGVVGRMDIRTGDIDYKVQCHKGQVNTIRVNPEVCQFASMGSEPSIRIWKIVLTQDELFVPIFEIGWKYPVHHVALVREAICFALSHHDSPTHKICVFNTSDTERNDHHPQLGHTLEVLSVSGSKELKLFCSASLDETVRVWNERCDLVRLLALNWIPTYAAFGTPQGDIFVGIENFVNVILANKYLPIIYRNRAMEMLLTPGLKEQTIPLSTVRTTQDPRMYLVLEEEDKLERERKEQEKDKEKNKRLFIPPGEKKDTGEPDKDIKIFPVEAYSEPKDSQRAKDLEKLKLLSDDLIDIMEGRHNFSIYIPDFHKMSKKQLDDYGKTIFTGPDGDKRKMFAAESRVAGQVEMERAMKELDGFVED